MRDSRPRYTVGSECPAVLGSRDELAKERGDTLHGVSRVVAKRTESLGSERSSFCRLRSQRQTQRRDLARNGVSPIMPAPIRIMHVVDSLAYGGMENGLVNVIERLDPERFEHGVCTIR